MCSIKFLISIYKFIYVKFVNIWDTDSECNTVTRVKFEHVVKILPTLKLSSYKLILKI